MPTPGLFTRRGFVSMPAAAETVITVYLGANLAFVLLDPVWFVVDRVWQRVR